ncbi:TIGR03756 family integrating conjugative element protein, partial [Burkholderia cenocepacia]|nr:TIGR03756 family integrating conjugative element protein [Burkholderia cenocepacia]
MELGHHQHPGRRGGPALCGLWRAGRGPGRRAHRATPEDAAVTHRPFDLLRRLRVAVASLLLISATGSYALNTATIVSSVMSPDCLEYRVVGICYWLYCTYGGCSVRTSVKVRH